MALSGLWQFVGTLFNHFSIEVWIGDSGLQLLYSPFFKDLRDLMRVQLRSFLSVVEGRALISCD